jgi:hypothetical protein
VAATVLPYGVQSGLLAAEHLCGVFAELHVVTTRRVVGLRAPWEDVDADGFTPASGVDEAFDEALGELHWWADVLRTARRDRPSPAPRTGRTAVTGRTPCAPARGDHSTVTGARHARPGPQAPDRRGRSRARAVA